MQLTVPFATVKVITINIIDRQKKQNKTTSAYKMKSD